MDSKREGPDKIQRCTIPQAANPHPDLYDTVVYPATAYSDTHPGQLAAMATLHGLHPVPVNRCRMLEIGCNTGANLIPMAYAIPGSHFTGFDIAAEPIARGQARIARLGLTNITLLQADLMDADELPEVQGKFDYIVAHGVYAWVPSPVRDGLLKFCRGHLADNGVLFISYATLPGGYMLMMARDMLSYRGLDPDHPAASVGESMDFLRFVATTRPEGDGYRVLLERQLENMVLRSPEVVFHDELATYYQPVMFSHFAKHAARHGLSYFSDSDILPAKDPTYEEETITKVIKLAGGNPLMREQILDFIRVRQYRESLLCHADQPFTYEVDTNALHRLRMYAPVSSSDGDEPGSRAFTTALGLRIETTHPAAIAVLEHLISRYPESVPYTELIDLLRRQDEKADDQLPLIMLRLIAARMVGFTTWQAPVTCRLSDRPVASLLCRQDTHTGHKLVTLIHTVIEISDPVAKKLIPLLDGSRDRAAILRDLTAALPDIPAQNIADGLDPALLVLARAGILEA